MKVTVISSNQQFRNTFQINFVRFGFQIEEISHLSEGLHYLQAIPTRTPDFFIIDLNSLERSSLNFFLDALHAAPRFKHSICIGIQTKHSFSHPLIATYVDLPCDYEVIFLAMRDHYPLPHLQREKVTIISNAPESFQALLEHHPHPDTNPYQFPKWIPLERAAEIPPKTFTILHLNRSTEKERKTARALIRNSRAHQKNFIALVYSSPQDWKNIHDEYHFSVSEKDFLTSSTDLFNLAQKHLAFQFDFLVGTLFWRRLTFSQRKNWLKILTEPSIKNPELLYREALQAKTMDDTDLCLEKCNQVIAIFPNHSRALFLKASLLRNQSSQERLNSIPNEVSEELPFLRKALLSFGDSSL